MFHLAGWTAVGQPGPHVGHDESREGAALTSGGNVVSATKSPNLVDLGNLLGGERGLLKVGANPRGRHGLGDDAVPADLGPGNTRTR